jgi:dTMP kinase
VTIEGPDGSGKTSQAQRLRRRAVHAGLDVVLTREPGGTTVGEQIRKILLDPTVTNLDPATDALLFNAARAQLVHDVIGPALERGALVISTRFADSTLAYQGHAAGVPITALKEIAAVATGGVQPDLTVLLDLPVELGLARKSGHEITRFETEFDVDFHRRVRNGFLALAAAEPERFAVVDASRAPDEVERDVLAAVSRLPGLSRVITAGTAGEPRTPAERIHR